MYQRFFKRLIDFVLSFFAFILLFPVLFVLSLVGAYFMKGSPFFSQPRPGLRKNGKETIFNLIKFRTMSNETDATGNLLPDSVRLNAYGKFLRSTSLDELPSLINIVRGDMAIVGPRPQLVRDMVFMSDDVRRRHDVRPGLTGLAQVNGRNNITWDKKFQYDLEYIENITFYNDFSIILKTLEKVLKRADVVRKGTDSDIDYGDWLLNQNRISREEFANKNSYAIEILKRNGI